jgi:hypothetical protein
MPRPNYKTVRLSAGKHDSPEDGACVMELASMLAREPFSDRPQSVCPVIGSFLRAYNDSIDADRREDLYDYAGKAVGTRATKPVERLRAEMCLRFARPGRSRLASLWCAIPGWNLEFAATHAARVAGRDKTAHLPALRLVDEMIAAAQLPEPVVELAPAKASARKKPERARRFPDRRAS